MDTPRKWTCQAVKWTDEDVQRILVEFGDRLRAERKKNNWSQDRLAEMIGNYIGNTGISAAENKPTEVGWVVLLKLAEAFGVDPLWLATGQGRRDADPVVLDRWQKIPDEVKPLMGNLEDWLGEEDERHGKPVDELAARRMRTVRLEGDVAAFADGSPEYDARQGEEVQIPEEMWFDGCRVVRARGPSMTDAEILERDLLVCEPAEMGSYHKGDVVIASTPHGMVVKVYGGQHKGIITLEPRGEGEPIVSSEIGVRAIVRNVWRER